MASVVLSVMTLRLNARATASTRDVIMGRAHAAGGEEPRVGRRELAHFADNHVDIVLDHDDAAKLDPARAKQPRELHDVRVGDFSG